MSLHQISESERQRAATTRARLERLGIRNVTVPQSANRIAQIQLSPLSSIAHPNLGSVETNHIAKSEPEAVLIVNEEHAQQSDSVTLPLELYGDTPIDRIDFLIKSMELLPPNPMLGELTTHRIVRVVAKTYLLKVSDLTGERRLAHLVRARHIAMWISRQLTPKSLPAIGRALGGRDHSTVLNGVRNIERARSMDPSLQAELDRLLFVLRPIKSFTSEDANADPGNPIPAVG